MTRLEHNIDLRHVRIEVITDDGRIYAQYGADVQLSLQDDGQTLKVFVTGGDATATPEHRAALIAEFQRILAQ